MKRSYKVGEKIPLSEIEIGDVIRFDLFGEKDFCIGYVESIEIPVANHLKSIVFRNEAGYALNHYPDQVTVASVVQLAPYTETEEEVAERKALDKFEALHPGVTFFVQYDDECITYTKVGDDSWVTVSIWEHEEANLEYTQDYPVFKTFYAGEGKFIMNPLNWSWTVDT